MAFNINDFKTQGLSRGGARPNLFQVDITPPTAVLTPGVREKLSLTCQAASIPPSQIGTVEVGYFGRKIKLAGDRTFPDWTVTILNDEDFLVRSMFEQWSNLMNSHVSNLKLVPNNEYKTNDAIVTQFAKNGAVIRQYSFSGIYPVDVSAMENNWDAQNTIQTFSVTFAYDYWVPYRTLSAPTPSIPTGQPGSGSSTVTE